MVTLILRRGDFAESSYFDALLEQIGFEHAGDHDNDDEVIFKVASGGREYHPATEYFDSGEENKG